MGKNNYRILIFCAIIAILSFTVLHLMEENHQKRMKEQGLTLEDLKSICIQRDTDLRYSLVIKEIEKTIQSEEYISLKNWELFILVSANNNEGIEKLTNMCPELDFNTTKEGFNTKMAAIAWTLKYNHEKQSIDILWKSYFTTKNRLGPAKNTKFDTIYLKNDPFFKYMTDIINNYLEQEHQKTKQTINNHTTNNA